MPSRLYEVRTGIGSGGNAQIKIAYGVGQNVWDIAYAGDELYTWLLSHRLTEEKRNEILSRTV